jgi:hypothetical protein
LEKIVNVQQQLPSPNLPLVDELVNPVPSSVNLVDQVIHPVPSSVELIDQVINSIDPTLPLEGEVKVVDPIPHLVNPTPLRKSEDVAQVFLVPTDSSEKGGTSPIPMVPPPNNEAIIFY